MVRSDFYWWLVRPVLNARIKAAKIEKKYKLGPIDPKTNKPKRLCLDRRRTGDEEAGDEAGRPYAVLVVDARRQRRHQQHEIFEAQARLFLRAIASANLLAPRLQFEFWSASARLLASNRKRTLSCAPITTGE